MISVNAMMKISAFENAIPLLKNMLKYLDDLADDMEHDRIRLEATVKLGLCYRNTIGWGSKIPMDLFTEANQLSKKIQCFDYMDTITYCIWIYYFMQIDLDKYRPDKGIREFDRSADRLYYAYQYPLLDRRFQEAKIISS